MLMENWKDRRLGIQNKTRLFKCVEDSVKL
jgi:hypothetical protein